MTRVLMTADAVGGVWTYAAELSAALRPADVHLAVMGPAPSAAQCRQLDADVRHRGFALEWMPEPWADVDAAGEWLLSLEDELRPDVVHLNGYAHAVLPWRAPVVVVAHSDVLSWWRAVHGRAAPDEWNTYRQRVHAGLAAADVVVAPTRCVLDDLQREYGFTGGVVVPNGRRADWVRPVPKEPLVLGAGRAWDEAKNLAALDRVAPHLPWPVATLDSTGFDQLSGWLLRASIFAAPARYEPFGLAILEAAQAGCALVLGDIPTLREVWGDAALFVRDEYSLAEVIARLADDPEGCADLGHRARCRAQRYPVERMARGYRRVYRGIGVPA